MKRSILAVVPARGGSMGLPRKNIRPLAGRPLLWHSLDCAAMAPEITRCIVSTDDREIEATAKARGGDVPFIRPASLAGADTAMMPVVRHALDWVEREEGREYDMVLLLDPTSPCRLPDDISVAAALLDRTPDAAGVLAVSEPSFNPAWVSVVEEGGWLRRAFDFAGYVRRQDVPKVLRINGALYLWRAAFVRRAPDDWFSAGRHVALTIDESRAYSIDNLFEFQQLEALIHAGLVTLPWLVDSRADA